MKSVLSAVLISAVAAFGLVVSASGQAVAQEIKREIVTTNNADYFGFDYKNEKNVSLDDCKKSCLKDI